MSRSTSVAVGIVLLNVTACSETATEPDNLTLGPPLAAVTASNTWIARADMPGTERWHLTVATIPNAAGQSILYTIGGKTSSSDFDGNGGSLDKVQAYNVATNTWSPRAALPLPVLVQTARA